MARTSSALSPALVAEMHARFERGETLDAVVKATGLDRSRLQRERAKYRSARAGAAPSSPAATPVIGDVPDQIPDDAPMAAIDGWIRRLESAADLAERQGNLALLAQLGAKVTALMALRHRSAPMPRADPNDDPDLKAFAARGRKRLETLVLGLFRPPA